MIEAMFIRCMKITRVFHEHRRNLLKISYRICKKPDKQRVQSGRRMMNGAIFTLCMKIMRTFHEQIREKAKNISREKQAVKQNTTGELHGD